MSLRLISAKSDLLNELRDKLRDAEIRKAEITGEIRAINEMIEFIEGMKTTADSAFEYNRMKIDRGVTDDTVS